MKTLFYMITLIVSVIITALVMPIYSADVYGGTAAVVDVNITPESFSWPNLIIGSVGDAQNLTIENIGTTNITRIYASVTMPSSNPYGTGSAANYNIGNFIMLDNDTAGNDFYYIMNKEFNETPYSIVAYPSNAVAQGSYKINTGKLFWATVKGGTGGISGNCTNGTFYIGTQLNNKTSNGDLDLTDNGVALSPVQSATWGVAERTLNGLNYCVFVSANCSQVVFSKWNMGATPYDDSNACSFDDYIFTGILEPGGNITVQIAPIIPASVAAGSFSQGVLTITVVG